LPLAPEGRLSLAHGRKPRATNGDRIAFLAVGHPERVTTKPTGALVPQSYTNLHYHLVFSTKFREPTITPVIRPRLYDYIGGLVRGEGGTLLTVGGMPDHVHLLVRLRQDRALSDVVRVVKTNSSKRAHDTFPNERPMWWQNGAGMFTVGRTELDTIVAYINNQEAHHRETDFRTEYRAILEAEGLDFDATRLFED
jgi:REP element-mobilizing transposase RayT